MNILVVCHYGLYHDFTYSFVHNQVREYVKLGRRVRVLIPNGIGKTGRDGGRIGKPLIVSKVDGVELYDLRYVTLSSYGEKHFNIASAIAAIRLHRNKILADFKPDVIHAHTLGFDSEIGAWLKKELGCPLVVTTHGSDTAVPLQKGRTQMLRSTCDKADAVVAVSNQLRNNLATCGTQTPLYTIHSAFVMRGNAGRTEKQPLSLIQVGNLVTSKRVDVTIQALAMLRKTYPDMTLTVVGQGQDREKLEVLCRVLNVAEAVHFTGKLPNQEVFELLEKSAFFVMASKPEGFGIVYLEAMASGCVTIGTEDQGIADIIVNGENGFLVPAGCPERIVEVIEKCIGEPEMAAAVAARGRETAVGMTWETNVRKYIELFGGMNHAG